MNLKMEKIGTAKDLPESWDEHAEEYFQKREFLRHTEKYNPSDQRYYVLYADDTFRSGLIMYSLKLDLLTYLPFSAKIRMHISGIPCSVSASGFVGDTHCFPDFIARLKNHEKGFHLFLNLDTKPDITGIAAGRTLPTIILENSFTSFDGYLKSIRSSYRRRYKNISRKFKNISINSGPCSVFSKEMYQQYLEVLKRSKGRLERLTSDFFKYLPPAFRLTHFYDSKELVGWHITLKEENTFYYFLGGINYRQNNRYSTYFNILFDILKQGIESGAERIDFGQTAEIPKMRLGGKVAEKFMLANHSNLLLKNLLIGGRALLEYSARFPDNNVLKDKP
jgi:hypothetical protein